MQWYPRYPGDYMRDTAHLSLTEHGAYSALLDHYYATCEPLPESEQELIRICRAFEDYEKQAVKKIAARFFPVNGDGKRHNKRADSEIVKAVGKSEKASQSAAIRWEKERNTDAMRTHIRTQCYPQPQPHPHPEPQPKPKKNTPHNPPRGAGYSLEFERFWGAYPNKKGKKEAWRAWQRAKDRPPIDQLIAEIGLQCRSREWTKDEGAYIPHPATWINRGGWEDHVKPI